MTDAYADPQAVTEALPRVRLESLGRRDAAESEKELREKARSLRFANARFDGVDRTLVGDPVPGRALDSDDDGFALVLFTVCATFAAIVGLWMAFR